MMSVFARKETLGVDVHRDRQTYRAIFEDFFLGHFLISFYVSSFSLDFSYRQSF